jgi:hypothetical protein
MGDLPININPGAGAENAAISQNLKTGFYTPGYRPVEWQQGSGATLTVTAKDYSSLSSPGGTLTQGAVDAEGNAQIALDTPFVPPTVIYVFDGIAHTEHDQEMVVTENPVQTGASLTDHSFMLPAKVTAEVLMSDAMQSFTLGQFTSGESRSASAYEVLQMLQKSRQPLQVATRIAQYSNMLITNLNPVETHETRFGLKCRVTFTQILTATVTSVSSGLINPSSARPQSTSNPTVTGSTQPQPVSQALVTQHSVGLPENTPTGVLGPPQSVGLPASTPTGVLGSSRMANVPGTSTWSSNNVSALSSLLGAAFF